MSLAQPPHTYAGCIFDDLMPQLLNYVSSVADYTVWHLSLVTVGLQRIAEVRV